MTHSMSLSLPGQGFHTGLKPGTGKYAPV